MKVIILFLIATLSTSLCLANPKWKKRAIEEEWTFSYSDATKHHTGLKKKTLPKHLQAAPVKTDIAIPDKLDLRQTADGGHRGLSMILDQGQCGSCWAFSLTASLRDGWRLAQKDPQRLSQQYLVDCADNAFGCEGGYFDAADLFIDPKGSPNDWIYPYTAMDGRCHKDAKKRASIVGWHFLGGPNPPTPKDIESWIVEHNAPVSITVAAGAGPWENYQAGIYNGCTMAQTDHMINIVGWDNEGATFDAQGNLPPGKGIWILRNSWGLGWGMNGWMKSKMTDANGKRCNNVAEEAVGFTYDVPTKK